MTLVPHPIDDHAYLSSTSGPVGAMPPRARVASDAGTIALNGPWRFHFSATPAEAPADATEAGCDDSGWALLEVPAHWELNGYGSPAYLESRYPFPLDPPHVPDANPTGHYRRWVTVPESWAGDRVLLRLDGVESCAVVHVDGIRVGWTQGSRNTVEFDVTDHLEVGRPALIALRVHKWSAGSYLEDQDTWRMGGVIRDVDLVQRPRGGVEDVIITADFEAATGRGAVRFSGTENARLRIPELGIDAGAEEEVVAVVDPWTAESPRLYAATVSTDSECVDLRIGFRRVEIRDGLLLVNGQRILFKGVNRHDFHAERGRVVTRDELLDDLVSMKRHNINAVRTAHYPPPPALLDLCDELGLYVIDECDLETHGFSLDQWRRNPVDDPRWRDAVLDRMRRCVARDRNHASVVLWSIGNECGSGTLLEEMRSLAHALDPARPVHYENDRPQQRYSDVFSRMYASPEEVERIGRRDEPENTVDPDHDRVRRAQPFILCEYGHAMGTGPGALRTYQDLFERYPRLQGGFVWEWSDQALLAVRPDGSQFSAYGGDFGEEVHDGAFICDGLVKPDRTPGSGLAEVKAVFAPLSIVAGERRGTVTVTSRRDFAALDDLELVWSIGIDGDELESGVAALPPVRPGEHATLVLAAPESNEGAILTVSARTRTGTNWAATGHEVARASWRIDPIRPMIAPATGQGPVAVPDGYRIGDARFDRRGGLVSIGALPLGSPELDVWRAPTDNDLAAPASAVWRSELRTLEHRVLSVEVTPEGIRRRTRSAGLGVSRGFVTTLHWFAAADGGVLCDVTIEPDADWDVPVPRLGLAFTAPSSLDVVSWEGLGPGETYPDMREAGALGVYRSTVADLQSHQARPQENGHRSDVSRLTLTGDARGVQLRAEPAIGFTARPWTSRALEAVGHTSDLRPGPDLVVTLDLAVHGLGSAACGPDVLPEHACTATARSTRLHLSVVDVQDT